MTHCQVLAATAAKIIHTHSMTVSGIVLSIGYCVCKYGSEYC
jgi:hypothetical protein